MNISKNVCVGMIITGLISYFDEAEKNNDKAIVEISSKLESKLTVFRYGTDTFKNRVKKAHKKKKKNAKDLELLEKLKGYNKRYVEHSKVSTDVWGKLMTLVKEDKFSINYLIISILKRYPLAKEYYKFSDKSLLALGGTKEISKNEHGYAFSSLKVANKILMLLDKEIECNIENERIAS